MDEFASPSVRWHRLGGRRLLLHPVGVRGAARPRLRSPTAHRGSGPTGRTGARAGVAFTLTLAVVLIVLVKAGTISQPAVVMLAFVPANVVGLGLLLVYRTPRPSAVGEAVVGGSSAPYAPLPAASPQE